MKKVRQREHALLLTVCYLAQLMIGTAQPFGLPATVLLPVLAAGTLVQLGLYRLLEGRQFAASPVFGGALAVYFCLLAGYDFVRADRFYRSVTDQQYSFWWLTGCMLLLGWYAAACGRPAVLRAALPVLAGLGLSLAVLAFTCSLRPEYLTLPELADVDLARAGQVFMHYTFGGEVLLWYYWRSHPTAQGDKGPSIAGWRAAVLTRFLVLAAFVLLAQLTLGPRFAQMPQVFGVLSLVASGSDAGHSGVVWHCIWLMALALRVCAVCCTLRELCADLLPRWPAPRRLLAQGTALAGAALVWTFLEQQDSLTLLAGGGGLLVLSALCCKKKGEAHVQ